MTKTWIEDANGNRCSVEYFGSREVAQRALDSLKDCSDCSDLTNAKTTTVSDPRTPPQIPIVPNLHQQLYAAVSQPGALNMGTWHKYEKKHCRAGWVVTLAGEQGRELEEFYDPCLAAMLIYDASCPGFKINPARFYDDNDAALADMKRLAGEYD